MSNKMMKLIGIFLIFIGVGYLGDEFNLWNFSIFFNGWWACLMVVLGIGSMLDEGMTGWNTFLTLAGVYFFLQANHFIHFRITFSMLVSIALIIIGVYILFSKNQVHIDYGEKETTSSTFENVDPIVDEMKTEEENFNSSTSSTEEEKRIYINANFGTKRITENGIVSKCHIESLFGTVLLDLSKADLRTLDFLSIESIFGTVEILMPADVNIKLTKNNIFSGAHVDSSISANGYDIYVRGTSVFGSIRINKMK